MADIFQCGPHEFSTNDIKKWDKHCAEKDHEYDLHTECDCGKSIHIKPNIKLGLKAKRIPTGYKCAECQKKAIDAPEIKEAGEVTNA